MDSDKTATPTAPSVNIDLRQTPDFAHAYANNVHYEPSFWDLKIAFGELDQRLGPNVVVQHTAINVPWSQVKIMAYFLMSHLITHEIQNGRIQIPPGIILPVPDEPPMELLPQIPKLLEIHAAMKAQQAAFIAENPEAFPMTTSTPTPAKSKK
jgi:hypothetical protein